MKVYISDLQHRNDQERYSAELRNNNNIIGFTDTWPGWDGVTIFFDHDHSVVPPENFKANIAYFSVSGSNQNEIRPDGKTDGYKFWASIHPSQVNLVAKIALENKNEVEREDVLMILEHDPKLEELLRPFALMSPFDTSEGIKNAKAALDAYLNTENA